MVRGGQDVQAVFTDLGDRPTLVDVTPIGSIVIDDYTEGASTQSTWPTRTSSARLCRRR